MFCLMFEVFDQCKIFNALACCSTGEKVELKAFEECYALCKEEIKKSQLLDGIMSLVMIAFAFVLLFVILMYDIPSEYWIIRFVPSFICFGITISRMTLGRYFQRRAAELFLAYEFFIVASKAIESNNSEVRT